MDGEMVACVSDDQLDLSVVEESDAVDTVTGRERQIVIRRRHAHVLHITYTIRMPEAKAKARCTSSDVMFTLPFELPLPLPLPLSSHFPD